MITAQCNLINELEELEQTSFWLSKCIERKSKYFSRSCEKLVENLARSSLKLLAHLTDESNCRVSEGEGILVFKGHYKAEVVSVMRCTET